MTTMQPAFVGLYSAMDLDFPDPVGPLVSDREMLIWAEGYRKGYAAGHYADQVKAKPLPRLFFWDDLDFVLLDDAGAVVGPAPNDQVDGKHITGWFNPLIGYLGHDHYNVGLALDGVELPIGTPEPPEVCVDCLLQHDIQAPAYLSVQVGSGRPAAQIPGDEWVPVCGHHAAVRNDRDTEQPAADGPGPVPAAEPAYFGVS